MFLPNQHLAIVEERKIVAYLLNLQHQEGRGKALFFLHCGFRPDTTDAFKKALLQHAAEHPYVEKEETKFGVKYVVKGKIETPHRVAVEITTIWMVPVGTAHPKLITAYPSKP